MSSKSWLALFLASAGRLLAQDPIAMVENPVGQAMVKPAGGEAAKPLQHGDTLMPRDRLQLASSGKVTLIFVATLQKREVPGALDAPVESLATDAPAPAAAAGSSSPKFSGLVAVLSAPQLEPQGGTRSPVPRTVRGRRRGFVDLLYPRNTAIREERPTFRWKPVTGAAGYEVTVLSGNLEPLVDRQTVEGDRFAYPEAAPALVAGRPYFWQVRAKGAGRRPGPLVYFSRLSQSEVARLDGEVQAASGAARASGLSAGSQALLVASKLNGAGLAGEALSMMRAALAADPRHKSLAQAIGVLNVRTGRHWASAEGD